MLVSWNWLKQYVGLDVSPDEFARRLMMAGLNHESTSQVDGDIAIDLEVTSNRPDCLGHVGIAREAAVLFNQPLTLPAAAPKQTGPPVGELTSVEIECPALCWRYTARVLRGVKVGYSPTWLRQRLGTIGIAAINNVVDATNYVMMECGQPLHAFDFARLSGRRIVVREPKPGEKLQAINHKTYDLEPGMCVIADARQAVGLGGVMGGAATEIASSTTEVLIEAAEFAPIAIRHAARRLKLFSDSSYRFERGLDPEAVDWASRRCCELILEIAGGELASGVIDVGRQPPPREPVTLRLDQIKRILGIEIDAAEVERILVALGNEKRQANKTTIEVVPPSWRRDLTREIDLIEEVARIHGYEAIPEDVSVPMAKSARRDIDRVTGKVRHVLTACGFDEAMTLSAVSPELSEAFSPWTQQPPLAAATPIIERANLLRRSLVPSLLAARKTNEALNNPRIELFEIAKAYLPRPGQLPQEELLLTLCSGDDFFSVKGVLAALLKELHTEAELDARNVAPSLLGPTGLLGERCAELWLGDERLGYLGELQPAALERFDLKQPCTVAEVRVAALAAAAQLIPRYQKPPEFPAMTYDINLQVDEPVRWSAIAGVVKASGGELLESIAYQEIYRNQKLADAGKKKVLFQVAFRGKQGTLTHEQANAAHDTIVAACAKQLGAERG